MYGKRLSSTTLRGVRRDDKVVRVAVLGEELADEARIGVSRRLVAGHVRQPPGEPTVVPLPSPSFRLLAFHELAVGYNIVDCADGAMA